MLKITENVPISKLTTMRLGGNARYVATIRQIEDIPAAYDFADSKKLPIFIIGSGANIIGHDEGFPGLVILSRLKGLRVVERSSEHLIVEAMSGENWDDLVRFTADQDYSGIEAMAKIPGTVGAAPVQNIGAYGQEIKDVIVSTKVFDVEARTFRDLSLTDMDFSYRRSIFNRPAASGRYFIVSITLKLTKTQLTPPFYTSLQAYVDDHKITDFSPRNIYDMVAKIRDSKLPNPESIASAGSFFKNITVSGSEAERLRSLGILLWEDGVDVDGLPRYKVNSGWLLEQAGLKGKVFHGFMVSEKAALVLINTLKTAGRDTNYADLAAARSAITKIIKQKYGLNLEQEPVELTAGNYHA